jgi:hypothetical protein
VCLTYQSKNERNSMQNKKRGERILRKELSFKKQYVAFKSPAETIIYCDKDVVWFLGACLLWFTTGFSPNIFRF